MKHMPTMSKTPIINIVLEEDGTDYFQLATNRYSEENCTLLFAPNIANFEPPCSDAKNETEKDNKQRRQSLIRFISEPDRTFISDLNVDGEEELSPLLKDNKRRRRSIFEDWKFRRPSALTTYSNRTISLPVQEEIPLVFSNQHKATFLHEGLLICAKTRIKDTHIDKASQLHWREYRAIITSTGQLILHALRYSRKHFGHSNDAQYRFNKRPSISLDLLHLSCKLSLLSPVDFSWSLSHTECNINNKRRKTPTLFYFQTLSTNASRAWYQSLYMCMPRQSKRALPRTVDLHIPELLTTIRIPLSELQEEGCSDINVKPMTDGSGEAKATVISPMKNIELEKVRESALTLLHRYGKRPKNWNRRTVGICWRYNNSGSDIQQEQQSQQSVDSKEWALKPTQRKRFQNKPAGEDSQTAFTSLIKHDLAYLIGPRLVEKTHALEMRYFSRSDTAAITNSLINITGDEAEEDNDVFAGLMKSISGRQAQSHAKHETIYYTRSFDHLLFLYEIKKCKKRAEATAKQGISRSQPLTSSSDNSVLILKKLIDLATIETITIVRASNGARMLSLNDEYYFEPASKSVDYCESRIKDIRDTHERTSETHQAAKNTIKQMDLLYLRCSSKRLDTFKRRLCVSTKDNVLYIFKPVTGTAMSFDFKISFTATAALATTDGMLKSTCKRYYILSGSEFCSKHITGLPTETTTKLYNMGVIEHNRDPSYECTFVVQARDKDVSGEEYIFIASSKNQKEKWVNSIACE